jgi:hypothetical protein
MRHDWAGFLITVNNSAATPIHNLLPGANYCQVYVPDTGTEQVLIISRNGNGSIRVPSGGGWELPARHIFADNEELFSVQTGTGSTPLQVVLMRKPY